MARLAWLTLGLVAAACFALVLAAEYHERLPRTHREAVMGLLDARGLRYHDVEVTSVCTFDPRDCAQFTSYAANVEVLMDRRVYGKIVCRRRLEPDIWEDCTLSLPEIGIFTAPLPQLAREHTWTEALERGMRYVEGVVRGLGR